jgi:hypothetical protein
LAWVKANKLAVIGAGLVLVIGFLVWENYTAQQQLKALQSGTLTAAQTRQLAAKVGKLYLVPTDEQPTIATVLDVSKLSGQAFFVNAKDGDKVLLYTKNSLAILYRPSINRVVQVAPIDSGIQSSASTPSPTPSPTKTPKH